MASAWVASKRVPDFVTCQPRNCVYGGEKVGHWSGGVMLLRAE